VAGDAWKSKSAELRSKKSRFKQKKDIDENIAMTGDPGGTNFNDAAAHQIRRERLQWKIPDYLWMVNTVREARGQLQGCTRDRQSPEAVERGKAKKTAVTRKGEKGLQY